MLLYPASCRQVIRKKHTYLCLYFRIKQQSSNIFSDVFMQNTEAVRVITEQVDNYNILD